MNFLNRILSPKIKSFFAWMCPASMNVHEFQKSWYEAMDRGISEKARQAIIKLGQEAAEHRLTGHDLLPASENIWGEACHIYWQHITGGIILFTIFAWLVLHTAHFVWEAFEAVMKYRKRIRPLTKNEHWVRKAISRIKSIFHF